MFLVRPPGAAVLASALLFGSALAASSLELPDSPPVSGVARDALGNLLEGVEILFLTEVAGQSPVAIVNTNDKGRFRVPDLAPGTYRVAAVKEGYLTYLGRIDTALDRSLDLLLRPSPQGDDPDRPLPEEASWSLRLPRRSMLREQDQAIPLGEREEADTRAARRRALHESVQVEVDQWFSVAETMEDGGAEATGLEGTETRMLVAGALGQRGSIRLHGHHERLARSSGDAPQGGIPDRESASVLLDLLYDTGHDTNLAVKAFYDERALDHVSPQARTNDELQQAARAWGYDAAWSKQIDSLSRVSVQLNYQDTTALVSAGPTPESGRSTDGQSARGFSNRRVGAQGLYESVAGDRHQISVDFRAQFADAPEGGAPEPSPAASAYGPGPEGWSLRLNAGDSWAVSGPITVTYGLGYRHSLDAREASVLVPRVGGLWSSNWASVRLLVSYYAPFWQGLSRGGQAPVSFQLDRPWGYDAEVEVPVLDSVRVKGAMSFAPMQFEYLGYRTAEMEVGSQPIYATDGHATTKRTAVGLAHQSQWVVTTVEASRGTAEGTLAAVASLGTPVRLLSDNHLTFQDGSVGVRIVPWGTNLLVDYLRIEEVGLLNPDAGAAFTEESVELRLIQDLIRTQALSGSWRLLLALRIASLDSDPGPSSYIDRPIASASHQLSAGVSVAF